MWQAFPAKIDTFNSHDPKLAAKRSLYPGHQQRAVVSEPADRSKLNFHSGSRVPSLVLETKVIRMFPKISQSRRRPLLGPSPG